ncbi:MAG: TatD family hydrolase [Bacteroidetes bacterium]|nr:TatD family hydrolase [Bacteroidota bacterium]MDA1120637.1 TatD family hydrolase [Bacteroidota bacterium]
MEFIDSHAHIYSKKFKTDVDDVINRSIDSGVTKIYMPNIDHTSIDDMLELELRFPEVCIPMMGLHPCSINRDFQKELYVVEEWLQKRPFVAVGEMGTDLYWDQSFWAEQQEVFKIQSEWAIQYDIPIVIHCRETIDDTISLVKELKTDRYRGIFHCFTGSVEQAIEIEKLGFWMGIGGVSTFKHGGLDEVIPAINIKSIVLETDSPYLSPVPHRGKRNEPSYIPIIAKRVSELKGMELEEVAIETTRNCLSIF